MTFEKSHTMALEEIEAELEDEEEHQGQSIYISVYILISQIQSL